MMVRKMPSGPRSFIGLLLTATIVAAAQQPTPVQPDPTQSDLVIRTSVRRVVEDVVVTDAQGNPVPGLTQGDFTIKEDKTPQRLLSFDYHDGSKPDYIPPRLPTLPPNTYVDVPSAPEQGPLYIILYDMVNTEIEDQGHARKPLLDFIDSKPPGTRFAIYVNTDKTWLLLGFTQNKELLRAALTYNGPGPHMPQLFLNGASFGKGNEGATLSLFNQLSAYFEGVPGHKNLIWLSDAFPLNLFSDPDNLNDDLITEEEVKETVASLTRAQIAVYPVDLRGVVLWDSASGAMKTGGATATSYIQEQALAENTGGQAFFSNNHIGELLSKAFNTGASFYTLTYAPPKHEEQGKQHNVDITLAKPEDQKLGYHLSYRRFYYDVAPEEEKKEQLAEAKKGQPRPGTLEYYRAQAKLQDTLYSSVLHGAPMQHDLIFSTHVHLDGKPKLATPQQMAQIQDEPAFFRTRHRDKPRAPMPPIPLQKFMIDYRVIDPELKRIAAQSGKQPTLEFAAAAYDADGRMVNGTLDRATANAPAPGQKEAAFFQVAQEIELPLGAAWLRIAVRDTLTDRSGTLEIHLPLKPEPASRAGSP
jgi:VWFA-related protein